MKKQISIFQHILEDITDVKEFTRDIIAHKYHTLNLDVIWAVVNHDIHTLELFVQKELKNIRSSEG